MTAPETGGGGMDDLCRFGEFIDHRACGKSAACGGGARLDLDAIEWAEQSGPLLRTDAQALLAECRRLTAQVAALTARNENLRRAYAEAERLSAEVAALTAERLDFQQAVREQAEQIVALRAERDSLRTLYARTAESVAETAFALNQVEAERNRLREPLLRFAESSIATPTWIVDAARAALRGERG